MVEAGLMEEDKSIKNILVIQGGGRAKGNTARLIEHFVAGVKEAGHSVEVISLIKNEVQGCMGCNAYRYGKPCIQKDSFNVIKDSALLMTAADNFFWTFEQAVSYYQFAGHKIANSRGMEEKEFTVFLIDG